MNKNLSYISAILMITGFAVSTGAAASTQEEAKNATKALYQKAAALGTAEIAAGYLFFGKTAMNGRFDIVHQVAKTPRVDCSIFQKTGNDFERISTTVISDRSSAFRTLLTKYSPAYTPITKGQAYYGETDVLGRKPYVAAYEPVKNASGEVVGIIACGVVAHARVIDPWVSD